MWPPKNPRKLRDYPHPAPGMRAGPANTLLDRIGKEASRIGPGQAPGPVNKPIAHHDPPDPVKDAAAIKQFDDIFNWIVGEVVERLENLNLGLDHYNRTQKKKNYRAA